MALDLYLKADLPQACVTWGWGTNVKQMDLGGCSEPSLHAYTCNSPLCSWSPNKIFPSSRLLYPKQTWETNNYQRWAAKRKGSHGGRFSSPFHPFNHTYIHPALFRHRSATTTGSLSQSKLFNSLTQYDHNIGIYSRFISRIGKRQKTLKCAQ